MSTKIALNALIQDYKERSLHETCELELRLTNISRDMFSSLFKSLAQSKDHVKSGLECSVDIVSSNTTFSVRGKNKPKPQEKYITKAIIKNGKKDSVSYHIKKPLRAVNMAGFVNYKVQTSIEQVDPAQTEALPNSLMRIKTRASFLDKEAKWRYDLTYVRQGSSNELGSVLKKIVTEMCTADTDYNNFIEKMPQSDSLSYEAEIEYVGRPAAVTIEDLDVVMSAYSLIDPHYLQKAKYQNEIAELASHLVADSVELNKFKTVLGLKALLNQVKSLDKNIYYSEVYPAVGYYVTEKADGKRTVIMVNDKYVRALASDGTVEYTLQEPYPLTIVDTEYVEIDGNKHFFVFDCMAIKGTRIHERPFSSRHEYISQSASYLAELFAKANIPIAIEAKKYYRISETNIQECLLSVKNADYPYKTDGIIFTDPNSSYRTTNNYKWKPIEDSSIDFLAIRCPQSMRGVLPYVAKKDRELYLLFVSIRHFVREQIGLGLIKNYNTIFPTTDISKPYPVQFSPSSAPLAYIYQAPKDVPDIDRKIVELVRESAEDDGLGEWRFVRTREDRSLEKSYYGNDFRTAEATYLNFLDPLKFDDLWSRQSRYFSNEVSSTHFAPNKFRRAFVISKLLNQYVKNAEWVIDEAAGRGADLFRYREIGVQNVLCMEVDPVELAELTRRKFELGQKKKRGGAQKKIDYRALFEKTSKSLTIHTLNIDLTTPADKMVDKCAPFGYAPGSVDAIVCNFAIHYMCDSDKNIANLIEFNATMLKPGGVFIFTTLDGEKVFTLLRSTPTGSSWEVHENDVVKYKIKKEYSDTDMKSTGMNISVKLPFADELRREPLANISYITKVAADKFELVGRDSFDSYLGDFEHMSKSLASQLTDDDKTYCSLHAFAILRRRN